jgi:hypothetical protein
VTFTMLGTMIALLAVCLVFIVLTLRLTQGLLSSIVGGLLSALLMVLFVRGLYSITNPPHASAPSPATETGVHCEARCTQ